MLFHLALHVSLLPRTEDVDGILVLSGQVLLCLALTVEFLQVFLGDFMCVLCVVGVCAETVRFHVFQRSRDISSFLFVCLT